MHDQSSVVEFLVSQHQVGGGGGLHWKIGAGLLGAAKEPLSAEP